MCSSDYMKSGVEKSPLVPVLGFVFRLIVLLSVFLLFSFLMVILFRIEIYKPLIEKEAEIMIILI